MSRLPRVSVSPLLPGLMVCLAVGGLSLAVAGPIPAVSGLVVAIFLGILWRNLAPYPKFLDPGTAFAAKRVLRLGIVLLGLQIPVGVVLGLGPWVLTAIVTSVGLTFWATMVVGRWLRMTLNQRLLMASGFSICGAAAIAGTDSVTESDEEDVASAIAMVVVFGTGMIALMPTLTALFGLTAQQSGLWIGLSTHEVAQVVAAGGAVGGALAIAVTVKLARVLMLAPVLAGISWSQRRRQQDHTQGPKTTEGGRRPPLVPLFVVGFIACVALGSLGWVPETVGRAMEYIQTLLLSTAMFALGLSVHVPSLIRVGGRPAVLGAASTLIILAIGGAAALLPQALGGSSAQ